VTSGLTVICSTGESLKGISGKYAYRCKKKAKGRTETERKGKKVKEMNKLGNGRTKSKKL
jgi:hypothetical protein